MRVPCWLPISLVMLMTGLATGAVEPIRAIDGSVRLRAGDEPGMLRVETASSVDQLALPRDVRLSAIAGTADGWVAAGVRPDGRAHRLYLVARGAGGSAELLAPPQGSGRHQIEPVLLVDDGQMVGAAWLEGDTGRSLAVRAAARVGSTFAETTEITSAGPGSQLALSGAVLDDGRWLLVWSAFDGNDDEIQWSVGGPTQWSTARSLHDRNVLPDILPAVVSADGGALVAWSQFDGEDYRLRLGRFTDGDWRVLPWRGGKGSVEAMFSRHGERLLLLYQTVVPDSWTVLDLLADGTIERRASVSSNGRRRPTVVLADDAGVRLEWPTESVAEPLSWSAP